MESENTVKTRMLFGKLVEVKEGAEKPVRPPSLNLRKRVFDKCFECHGGERSAVDACEYDDCPLYHWRNAKARKAAGPIRKAEREKAKATGEKIRQPGMKRAILDKCLDCCVGQRSEVNACPAVDCPIHFVRNAKARKLALAKLAGATPEELAAMEAKEKAAEDAGTAIEDDDDGEGDDMDTYGNTDQYGESDKED